MLSVHHLHYLVEVELEKIIDVYSRILQDVLTDLQVIRVEAVEDPTA